MTTAVEAASLSKRYGRRQWALRDCSLTLPTGKVAALVGPNGAGKTTLLHLVVGLLEPTSGAVRTLGSEPRERPDVLHHALQLGVDPLGFAAPFEKRAGNAIERRVRVRVRRLHAKRV